MGFSAAQSAILYREAAQLTVVWGIRDQEGFPAPVNAENRRVMPFWSSKARAIAMINKVPTYQCFDSVPIALDIFCERWLPGLLMDGLLVGVNWAGTKATGFDCNPEDVLRNIRAALSRPY